MIDGDIKPYVSAGGNTYESSQSALENADIAIFMQGLVLVCSTFLSGFYVLQKLRGRCTPEVIYVAVVTMIIYSSTLLSGKSLVWVSIEGGIQVPLGRYFSWLMTCPVILMQFIKLFQNLGNDVVKEAGSFIVMLDQIMIVAGAFGAVSQGIQKWIFFIISCAAGAGLFFSLYMMCSENISSFPKGAKGGLKLSAGLFFFSWMTFPILWVLGSPGLNLVSQNADVILHSISDLIAKNLFGLAAWNLKWNQLSTDVDSNGKLVAVSKQYIPSHFKGNMSSNKALTDDDISIARNKPYAIMLLNSDPIIFKLMTLLMEKIEVTVHSCTSISSAKTMLSAMPVDNYDAVIVCPGRDKINSELDLRTFSELISQPPYKLPMLGCFFDDEVRNQEPGYYIHGIVPRPLDEVAFKSTLLEWRITAMMWRRVADSVEAIGGYQNPLTGSGGSKSPVNQHKKFGSQLVPGFVQVDTQVAAGLGSGNSLGAPTAFPFDGPGLSSPRNPMTMLQPQPQQSNTPYVQSQNQANPQSRQNQNPTQSNGRSNFA